VIENLSYILCLVVSKWVVNKSCARWQVLCISQVVGRYQCFSWHCSVVFCQ